MSASPSESLSSLGSQDDDSEILSQMVAKMYDIEPSETNVDHEDDIQAPPVYHSPLSPAFGLGEGFLDLPLAPFGYSRGASVLSTGSYAQTERADSPEPAAGPTGSLLLSAVMPPQNTTLNMGIAPGAIDPGYAQLPTQAAIGLPPTTNPSTILERYLAVQRACYQQWDAPGYNKSAYKQWMKVRDWHTICSTVGMAANAPKPITLDGCEISPQVLLSWLGGPAWKTMLNWRTFYHSTEKAYSALQHHAQGAFRRTDEEDTLWQILQCWFRDDVLQPPSAIAPGPQFVWERMAVTATVSAVERYIKNMRNKEGYSMFFQ
ncbi:hypothetical protein L226DRAFT_571982 [Lentinus tigrinus ALCF2SS1-7]|uniref:uncharacterized protein n=1 Tax=Lentinus tigrinus ALCF2SS1-7 TaxID=1328758 RepID=UPI001165F454|nr:hypothetical protein L226DRAFT_571982 [Lentinus tigrinus ALCF2SS1-7]